MNILYVNHYAGSVELGMEFRPWLLANEWQKQGHKTRIVASDFSHLRFKNKKFDDDYHLDIITNQIEYLWLKTFEYKTNGIKRFLNILLFVFKLFFYKKLTKDFKPDVVVASSTYPLDVIPCYFIAKIFKEKLIHEVHDLWPLTLKEIGGFKSWHPMIIVFQLAENFSYRNADRVVSMLSDAWLYMKDHGLKKDKYMVVPNGVRLEDWSSSDALSNEFNELIDQKKKEGFFLIGYAGSMGPANALNFLVESLALIKQEKIFIFMVGKGVDKDDLRNLSMKIGISNIHFFNNISKTQIPTFLEKMDSLYIGWQNKPIYRFGINPNKLLDYMMAGKPIVHSVNAANDWVQIAKCGISVPAENTQKISEALVAISKISLEERQLMSSNAKNYVIDNHSYEKLASRFLSGLK